MEMCYIITINVTLYKILIVVVLKIKWYQGVGCLSVLLYAMEIVLILKYLLSASCMLHTFHTLGCTGEHERKIGPCGNPTVVEVGCT